MTITTTRGPEPGFAKLKPLLVILLLVSVLRAYLMTLSSVDLFVDEIQYWWWSLELDWGYFSKPPMVAVLIYLVTSVFGHSVFAIKLGALLVYPATTLIIYLLGQKLVSETVGFWSAVLFITLPGVALSSTITSTDVLLVLFWSAGMLCFIRSIETNSWFDWIACGIICGLGLLSKYNMAIFSLSALGYMLFFGHAAQLKNPRLWIMAGISLMILAPNIYWNYINGFPTITHTAGYVAKKGLYPGRMISFIFEQAGIIGPVGFIVMWWWIFKGDKPKNLMLNFSMPMFVIICMVALQGKHNANWAAPMYVSIIIGMAHFLQNRKKWLKIMLITNIVLGLMVQISDPLMSAAGVELKEAVDPFARVRGWKSWGQDLKTYTDRYPDLPLIVAGRHEITEVAFYTFGKPDANLLAWRPGPGIRDHFQLTRPYTGGSGPALFLTILDPAIVGLYFSDVQQLGTVTRKISRDSQVDYTLYRVEGFKGYDFKSG